MPAKLSIFANLPSLLHLSQMGFSFLSFLFPSFPSSTLPYLFHLGQMGIIFSSFATWPQLPPARSLACFKAGNLILTFTKVSPS
jgi:hypothetical protein